MTQNNQFDDSDQAQKEKKISSARRDLYFIFIFHTFSL